MTTVITPSNKTRSPTQRNFPASTKNTVENYQNQPETNKIAQSSFAFGNKIFNSTSTLLPQIDQPNNQQEDALQNILLNPSKPL